MRGLGRASAVTAIVLLALGSRTGHAQAGEQQRAVQLAYQSEMAHEGNDCPNALTLIDRNECLNNVRTETYKNFDVFFRALREVLIEESPNDANALALDAAENTWEKYRQQTCDAMIREYDIGTVKHPGSTQPSAQTRCLIELTRSRMRDLMGLYQPSL